MGCRKMLGILGLLLLLGMTSCFSRITSSTPPNYYQLGYVYEPVDCSGGFDDPLQVWPFSAASPYGREEMLVINPSFQVEYSRYDRWIAPPGQMVADILVRDLSESHLFPKVVAAGDPFAAPLALGGQIFKYAWERHNSKGRAVLNVEVTLWEDSGRKNILLRKNYQLEGELTDESSPEAFAASMSELVKQMSRQLRRDICAIHRGSLSQASY